MFWTLLQHHQQGGRKTMMIPQQLPKENSPTTTTTTSTTPPTATAATCCLLLFLGQVCAAVLVSSPWHSSGCRESPAGAPGVVLDSRDWELMWFVQAANRIVNYGLVRHRGCHKPREVLAHTTELSLALKDFNQLSLLKFARRVW